MPGLATRGLLRIGDVAERTALSLRTIRYYEQVGLLPAAERSPGGFRLYGEAAVQRLLVIRQMKPLEFSLEETAELLTALDAHACAEPGSARRAELDAVLLRYAQAAQERVTALEQRLATAQSFRAELARRTSEAAIR